MGKAHKSGSHVVLWIGLVALAIAVTIASLAASGIAVCVNRCSAV